MKAWRKWERAREAEKDHEGRLRAEAAREQAEAEMEERRRKERR